MTVTDSTTRVGPGEASIREPWARSSSAESGRIGWGWICLGLAGSIVITIAAPSVTGGRWWFDFSPLRGYSPNFAVTYIGIAALSCAWLGVGARLRNSPKTRLSELWKVGAVWAAPLLLAPPLFSHDVYSYLAQGAILHLGYNPYHEAPVLLAHLGQQHLLDAVSSFWRNSTAPYGPGFVVIMSAIVGVAGSHLFVAVIVARLVEVVGVALLAVFVPRLARLLGADPLRATWIAVISPLILFELIGAGHNDALMAGLMVAGVTLALERHPLIGIAICAAAATIKLPALAAALFIAVAWARTAQSDGARARILLQAALVAVGVIGAVSLLTGVGLDWISTSLFSTPARVHLAITPGAAVGWTVGPLFGLSAKAVAHALGIAAAAATVLLGAAMLWRVRRENLVRYLGVLLLVAALAGPVVWPWYFVWGLVLISACPEFQYSRAIPFAVVLAAFAVKPSGTFVLHLSAAPYVLACYVLLAGVIWQRAGRRAILART
jgi:hypothetical protein